MSTSEIAKLESRWRDNPQGLTFAPLAEAYRKQGDPVRALEILLPGLERHPDYIPANIVLGRCHWDLDALEASEQAFAHVLELDGENVIALKAMADIAERRGRYDEAERWVEKLLTVDRSNDEAREQLARLREIRREAQPEAPSGAATTPAASAPPEPERAPKTGRAELSEPVAALEPAEPAPVPGLVHAAAAPEPPPVTPARGPEPAPLPDDYEPARVELPDPDAPADAPAIDLEPAREAARDAREPAPAAEPEPAPEPEFELAEEIELRVSGETEYQRPSAAEELARSAQASAARAEVPSPADAPAIVPGPADVPGAPAPEPAAVDEPPGAVEPGLLVTETMADVYLQQGHVVEALAVYRELVRRKPGDAGLRARVAELEQRQAAAGAGAGRPRYSARETGGQSVAEFFQALLDARPAFPQARPAGPRPGAAEPAPAGRPAEGPAIRPAADPISLDSVFGEEPSPVSPAAPGQDSARRSGPPGVSFDDFFGGGGGAGGAGGGTPGGPSGPSGGSARGKRDDDLDQFQSWLQSLKR